MNASEGELSRMEGYVHRTFNNLDLKCFILSLRHLYLEYGGMENVFALYSRPEGLQEAITKVRARFFAIDVQGIWVFEMTLIAVCRRESKMHRGALGNGDAVHLHVLGGRAAHECQRRLPADDLGHCVRDLRTVRLKHIELLGPPVHGEHPTGDGVTGGVVAADDEQEQCAEELAG